MTQSTLKTLGMGLAMTGNLFAMSQRQQRKNYMFFSKLLCNSTLFLALCAFPLAESMAACSDSGSLKTFMEKGDYRRALQNMDSCLIVQEQPLPDDQQQFNNLIKQVLHANPSISFNEAYRNFQAVLGIYLLKSLEFKLNSDLEKQPKEEAKLFSSVREKGEKYYFYYDTGRLFPYARGIALTDQSLIWKNLAGSPHRLAFNEINSIRLVYERGLSLTGWKLIVNDDKNHDIRLSKVPDEAITPFVSAMIYFINSNKTSPDKEMVQFHIADREIAILAGWVTLCSDKHVDQSSPITELQLLDACFNFYGKDFKLSKTDSELLRALATPIFEKTDLPFADGYKNFKAVLSTHFFHGLSFKFDNHLDAKTRAKLFKAVRQLEETYYFYFDMGRVVSGNRGLALTEKAIFWQNLLGSSMSWDNLSWDNLSWDNVTGSANRLAFDEITSITLVHEETLGTIIHWKLRLNQNTDNEIILSQLSQENLELFASALVYFINMAQGADLTLQIPVATREVLSKTFLERHPKIKSITDSVFGVLF